MISIHAPRAGSDANEDGKPEGIAVISIHAPRAGSDVKDMAYDNATTAISIHAPRAGSDFVCVPPAGGRHAQFQSTLPVRGATPTSKKSLGVILYFNPRSPCGERPAARKCTPTGKTGFQSTLPVRGATLRLALRGGGD